MKIRMFILLGVCVWAGFSVNAQPKNGDRGAFFAKLPDDAVLEMLIDELQHAAQHSRMDLLANHRAVQQLVANQPEMLNELSLVLVANLGKINVYRAENAAVIELENGSRMNLAKTNGGWQISDFQSLAAQAATAQTVAEHSFFDATGPGYSAGQTFRSVAIDKDLGIRRLNRTVSENRINRKLFGAPEKSASYYRATYAKTAPYVRSNYVQFVIDSEWNRVVYGNLGKWIKSYDDVIGPAAIAVDTDGRVFIGESGRNRISVLQLDVANGDGDLRFLFAIEGIGDPVAIATDDAGTPLDVSDDALIVADASKNELINFKIYNSYAERIGGTSVVENPQSIAVGKWNGVSSGLVYVADDAGQRLKIFAPENGELRAVRELQMAPGTILQQIKSDHFGNIFAVDANRQRLLKFAPDLTLLDEMNSESGGFSGLASVEIPFGRILVEGEGEYWSGFDQLFTVERWQENAGAQRMQLGTAIHNARFASDDRTGDVLTRFTVTDAAHLRAQIWDAEGNPVRDVANFWISAGQKTVAFERRDDNGQLLPGGNYRLTISAKSPYRDEQTELVADVYLPLFYSLNCGDDVAEAAFLQRGDAVKWGDLPSQSATRDAESVVYHFAGLDPNGEYALNLAAVANDGKLRHQRVFVNDNIELTSLSFSEKIRETGFVDLPKAAFADGAITISVERDGQNDVWVSQMMLKETGRSFAVISAGDKSVLPEGYELADNFPNPFNPETTIRFRTPQTGVVRLEIFNILGQKVAELVNRELPSGEHAARWNGANSSGEQVASGFYFYRLTAGTFQQTRRMLLLK